jgi:3-oxoisoapionate decarboxylase
VLAECHLLGVDGVSLETCFLGPPVRLDAAAIRAAADDLELILAWGHLDGLAFGADPGALTELLAWIALAPRLGCSLVRLVVASPRLRPAALTEDHLRPTWAALRAALDAARRADVVLAVENHADLTADELAGLLDRVGDDRLGVCLDTANALRVGDDPVEAARLLAPRVRQVHLKDCAPDWDDPVTGPVSVPYGSGAVPVAAVLDALGALPGLVCVELGHLGPGEVDERAMVADGVRWLRSRAA